MNKFLSEYFFYYFTVSSLLRFFLVLIFSGQTPITLGEKRVRMVVTSGIILDGIHVLFILLLNQHLSQITINDFLYFSDSFKIIWNPYSTAFFIFCISLISLIARFSSFYLHRDHYFYKFFSLLFILELAVSLLVLTSSSESIFIGWELLGLSSVLLIAFYEHRMSVLKNSLIILVIYKIADVIFYTALISSAYFGSHIYTQIDNPVAELFILIACLIKSSIFPWIWLPRAMEGPTPSSAIFYGGIATHIPMFIFLNISMNHPNTNPMFTVMSIGFILVATVITSLMSKQATDAKNAIAYASITQLGIIYIEILMGFYTLALIHGIVNGIYRSFEFLKSPSLIYQRHTIEKRREHLKHRSLTDSLIPQKMRDYLYKLAYHEFFIPRMIIHGIEFFLGLQNSRTKTNTIKNYLMICLAMFFIFELCIYYLLHIKVGFLDESLLLLGLSFNFIATLYKYKPGHFFIVIMASTLTVFTLLFEHIHQITLHLEWIFLIILAYFIFDLLTKGITVYKPINFTGRFFKSTKTNIIILITGISVIGIPGLTSYIIWERLEHELLPYYPNLIMEGFFILALNTVLFFRFYYANFLGKRMQTTHYEAIKRV
ncbi:proton-conducting transporter membrane subunit [Legionella quateirensis]|uniref:NADH dehydrogenase I subunit L n=1 Tax=Legionella quateirensis TaxID=45072 RepID=A0A378KVY7_9GAMM|nr:proton-conducting transporter membrane subunit [Legionella quateirensis]KTD46483.1 NADH-quinone oxidoreductase chain L [Legionella quateirensis]STY18735.1 NADH dehydrogenase I subunit L [Legionella quateirensis]